MAPAAGPLCHRPPEGTLPALCTPLNPTPWAVKCLIPRARRSLLPDIPGTHAHLNHPEVLGPVTPLCPFLPNPGSCLQPLMRQDPFQGPEVQTSSRHLPAYAAHRPHPFSCSGSARPLLPRLPIGRCLRTGPSRVASWAPGVGPRRAAVQGSVLCSAAWGPEAGASHEGCFSAEDVQRVVDTNQKRRFALRPGDPGTGPLIRANQGHSLQVPELELTPLETPQALPLMLVHGTFWQHWPSILLKGLSCRGRTHIHLAPGLPGDPGVISGIRPNCEVAVFIDGPLALADGVPFFRSANGVILTPGNADGFLLPKYFKAALQLRPTRKSLSLAGNEETECQSGPENSSRGKRMI
uniref:tRNA phosphotransferase 1 n=1 Tax=Suricata suricatta TaxID=37032 RepID=A0A673VJN1_SURSU